MRAREEECGSGRRGVRYITCPSLVCRTSLCRSSEYLAASFFPAFGSSRSRRRLAAPPDGTARSAPDGPPAPTPATSTPATPATPALAPDTPAAPSRDSDARLPGDGPALVPAAPHAPPAAAGLAARGSGRSTNRMRLFWGAAATSATEWSSDRSRSTFCLGVWERGCRSPNMFSAR